MEKIVTLKWRDLDLGTLYKDDKYYVFVPKYENKELAAQNGCPVNIVFYSQDEKYISEEIFYFFSEFIFEDTRDDLKKYISEFNVTGETKEIVKLRTVAKLNLNKNGFWIE